MTRRCNPDQGCRRCMRAGRYDKWSRASWHTDRSRRLQARITLTLTLAWITAATVVVLTAIPLIRALVA